jgi:hypothetical protein
MENHRMRRSSTPAVLFIAFMALLPLFYLLSTGPAVWLHARGMIDVDKDPWAVVYAPVGPLCDSSKAFSFAMEWYLHHWDSDTYPYPYWPSG